MEEGGEIGMSRQADQDVKSHACFRVVVRLSGTDGVNKDNGQP